MRNFLLFLDELTSAFCLSLKVNCLSRDLDLNIQAFSACSLCSCIWRERLHNISDNSNVFIDSKELSLAPSIISYSFNNIRDLQSNIPLKQSVLVIYTGI